MPAAGFSNICVLLTYINYAMRFRPIILLAGCLFTSIFSIAQDSLQYTIALKSGGFIPRYNITNEELNLFGRSAFKTEGKLLAVIQFQHIPTPQQRKQLKEAGIELLDFIAGNAYHVAITGELNPALLQQVNARSVFNLSATQKMEEGLAKGYYPSWSMRAGATIEVWCSFSKGISYETLTAGLRKNNFDISLTDYKQYNVIGLRVPAMRLQDLASLPYIDYVQPAPHEDQALNSNSRFLSRANVLNASFAAGGRQLDGQGVVVGVGDNGDVQSHIDFTGRLINRAAFPFRGHAAHVHGTIGGAGLIESLYTGYAPKSTLVSQLFGKIFTNAPTYIQDYGMVITNNSFGSVTGDCNYNGLYDLSSRVLDQQAIDLPELQQVFAAGNDGSMVCDPYAAGFHTVLGGYQSAKNVLTVGSTEYNGNLSWFSSRGPARDGRLKPEIMSHGQFVASTWVTNQYSYNNGTSMAAPGVSGGLALLVQRYRQLHANANPPNALMKALICNGGADRGKTGPDFNYGFGSLNLLRSLDMMENNHYLNSTVAHTGINTHSINVPANTSQLKVLLYWQDPPAAVMATKALVNNLDLSVVGPGGTVLPQVLDTLRTNLDVQATTGVDNKNNIEQVIINNPAAGSYAIHVNGTAVTQNPTQPYFVVYDFVPDNSLVLTNPVGGETFVPTVIPAGLDTVYIQWDYYGSSNNDFTIEYSANDGGSWTTLSNAVPSASRIYSWAVPDLTVEKARIRISKNGVGLTQTSLPFTISRQSTLSLDAVQCEGYIKLNWTAIAGATDYEVMMHQNGAMVPVATTTNLTYTFSGLIKDSVYWVTVRPRMNGTPGRRSFAISRQPNSGDCSGTISDRDLKIDSLLTPLAGRLFTSTALTVSTPISFRVKNLDNDPVNSYKVKYSLNGGGSWVEQTINTAIGGGTTAVHTFPGVDFSAVGSYPLLVAVENLDAADPVLSNNELSVVIRQLDNQPLNLATTFLDNLEAASFESATNATIGLAGVDRYDFSNSSVYGRVRPFINSGIAYSGSKALSLDATLRYSPGNTNYLNGTFNLTNYDEDNDYVRVDFRFKNHGQTTNANNKVWIRGNDNIATPWIEAYDLFANQNEPGSYKRSASIELSRLLKDNSQSFSPGFQVRWGQYGIDQATDDLGGSGYTIDDIRLYTVLDDLSMVSIDTPYTYSCGLNATVPVKITVRNTTNATISNIPVKFRTGNTAFITPEIIPSIAANTSVQYTFTATANLSAIGTDTIIAVVSYPSDSFRDNDTVTKLIVNLPLVTTYPYLQNFEAGDGSWYTLGGTNSSWQYGTPISPKINRAASGSKAWKTNIAGYYNDGELSYLYSPCFNLSGMTTPTLSFSVAMDIEDCNASLCDAAWMEYSSDGGSTWNRLGTMGTGTNWYNRTYAGQGVWSQENYHRWHVATTPLPTTNNSQVRFRFVFNSDVALNKDGIAVDDIHIYDNIYGIYDGATMGAPVTQTINTGTNNWVNFLSGSGKLVASVHPNGQEMGVTNVQAYIHTGAVRINSDQYYHNRNITIKPDPALVNLADSATVRFYFLDSETEALINATGCNYCTKPSMAYELGVSKYSDPDDSKEDGDVGNNAAGSFWSFIKAEKAVKVPFDKGYYAEFKVKDFSEFWLNDGWYDKSQPLPLELLSFTATKTTDQKNVLLKWTTTNELDIERFELEVAKGNQSLSQNNFVKIGELPGQGNSTSNQYYTWLDDELAKSGARYYRLKIIEKDGRFSYSDVRPVVFTDEIKWQVFPNPSEAVFNLTYQLPAGETLKVRVLDASGRVVYQASHIADGFVQKLQVDLGAAVIAKGLYLLEAGSNQRLESFKLLKK